MASPHVTEDEIDQFHRRQLPGDGLVRFADHLADCHECRDRVAAGRDAGAAVSALQEGLGIGEDDHLGEDEIQAFVDGGLDSERRAAISAHLAECRACAGDVRDLSEFAATLRHEPASRWTYAGLAAAAVLVLAVGAGLVWRERASPSATARTNPAGALAPADAAVVRDAIASGRLSLPPAVSELRGRHSPVLGDAAAPSFSLVSPVATVVLDPRPALRWTARAGTAAYVVTLQDQATGATINSPPVHGTEWTPERPLVRGRTYAWQVGVAVGATEDITPRPPDPPARFMIADAATAARLEHLPESPLARGVLYASAGLLDAAAREFEAARAHGDGGDRADAFLAELRRAR